MLCIPFYGVVIDSLSGFPGSDCIELVFERFAKDDLPEHAQFCAPPVAVAPYSRSSGRIDCSLAFINCLDERVGPPAVRFGIVAIVVNSIN
jgi:hypothetical protein